LNARLLGPLLGALAGAALFFSRGGWAILPPRSIQWMLTGDWQSCLFGWLYSQPGGFPLGHSPGLLHPTGSSLAGTDALPLLGTLLPAPVPGSPWQYFGAWLFACWVLQGFFGALIASTWTPRPLLQAAAGMLFASSPVLAGRLGHLSLCGHWLVLWALWLALRAPTSLAEARRIHAGLLAVAFVSGGVHPYLSLMVFAIAVAAVMQLPRDVSCSRLEHLARLGSVPAATFGSLYVYGFFSVPRASAPGFDTYTAELLTLLNPAGLSHLLPEFRRGGGQYEGTAWLGIGTLLLLALAMRGGRLKEALPWREPRLRWLLAAVLAMFVFSLGSSWQLFGHQVISFRGVVKVLFSGVAESLRAPGRFAWPLHYLVLATAAAAWLRPHATGQRAAWMIGACALLQWADLTVGLPVPPVEDRGRASPVALPSHVQHLALVPATVMPGAGDGCPDPRFTRDEASALNFAAWNAGLTTNSAYTSRVDSVRVQAACAETLAEAREGRWRQDTLYVVHRSLWGEIRKDGADCGEWLGEIACLAPGPDSALRQWLRTHPAPGTGDSGTSAAGSP
jgi:hypothetical protein